MHQHPLAIRLLAASLAAVAGFVDAVGFVSSGGYFASFMSGNSTRLGVFVADGVGFGGVALLLIAAFVGGAASGARLQVRGAVARLTLVVLPLLVASGVHAWWPLIAVALAAFAMGALNTVGVLRVSMPVGLTYMTGTLVKLGAALGQRGAGRWAEARPYLVHWCALVAGAALGAIAYLHVGGYAFAMAAVLLVVVGVMANRGDAASSSWGR